MASSSPRVIQDSPLQWTHPRSQSFSLLNVSWMYLSCSSAPPYSSGRHRLLLGWLQRPPHWPPSLQPYPFSTFGSAASHRFKLQQLGTPWGPTPFRMWFPASSLLHPLAMLSYIRLTQWSWSRSPLDMHRLLPLLSPTLISHLLCSWCRSWRAVPGGNVFGRLEDKRQEWVESCKFLWRTCSSSAGSLPSPRKSSARTTAFCKLLPTLTSVVQWELPFYMVLPPCHRDSLWGGWPNWPGRVPLQKFSNWSYGETASVLFSCETEKLDCGAPSCQVSCLVAKGNIQREMKKTGQGSGPDQVLATFKIQGGR